MIRLMTPPAEQIQVLFPGLDAGRLVVKMSALGQPSFDMLFHIH
jgi:hypothetical protein